MYVQKTLSLDKVPSILIVESSKLKFNFSSQINTNILFLSTREQPIEQSNIKQNSFYQSQNNLQILCQL